MRYKKRKNMWKDCYNNSNLDPKLVFKHLNSTLRSHQLFRHTQKKWIAGICSGLALKFNLPAFFVRVTFFIMAMMTGFIPFVVFYIIAAFVMEDIDSVYREQEMNANSSSEKDKYMTTSELIAKFEGIDRKLQKMESFVISPKFELLRMYKKL